MSNKKKTTEELVELPAAVEVPEPKAAFVRAKAIKVKPAKLISFDVWAQKRSIKDHHKGGMRAFVKNPNQPRTEEAWDSLFANY